MSARMRLLVTAVLVGLALAPVTQAREWRGHGRDYGHHHGGGHAGAAIRSRRSHCLRWICSAAGLLRAATGLLRAAIGLLPVSTAACLLRLLTARLCPEP